MTEKERRQHGRRGSDQWIKVFQQSHHAMVVIDAQLEIRQSNHRGNELLPALTEIHKLFAAPEHNLLRWQLAELVNAVIDGQLADGCMEAQLQDLTLAIDCQPLQITHTAVLTLRDITRQKQHQNQFLCLGATAAGIAHELSSPLAALSTELELIQQTDSTGLKNCQQLVARMQLILRELSGCYSNPDFDSTQQLPVVDTVQKAVRLLRFDPRSQLICWRQNIPPRVPKVCMAEKHFLLVALNLLDNAIKACHHNVQPEIQISIEANTTQGLELTVTDNGADAENQQSSSKYHNGLGIGLTICSQIIHSYDGELELEQQDSGTTARLRLPSHQCRWPDEIPQGEQG